MKYLVLLLSLFMVACSKPGGSSDSSQPTDEEIAETYCLTFVCPSGPPEIVSYPANKFDLTINQQMPTIKPIVRENFTDAVYRTSLDLPEGLIFDKETGEISGTPTEIYNEREILIIVDNRLINSSNGKTIAGGIDIYPITFSVKNIPPEGIKLVNEQDYLLYKEKEEKGQATEEDIPSMITALEVDRGDSIEPLTFKFNNGGEATEYNIEPELPVGLSFSNFRITGRPLISQQETNYKITFRNSGGTQEINLSILVRGIPPSNLSYFYESPVYKAGLDIEGNPPIYEGDTANNFSVEPALPIGLLLNTQTGEITGNPEEIVSNQNYLITASNDWGQTQFQLSLTVEEFVSDIETGDSFSCAIKNKKVYCWGLNNLNQLGSASNDSCLNEFSESNPCTKTAKLVKKNQEEDLRSLKLASSKATTCSLNEDKTLDCWGDNSFGQLGSSNSVSNTLTPLKVTKEDDSVLSNVKEIKGGNLFFCSSTELNELYCWGDNTYKQIDSSEANVFKAKKIAEGIDFFSLGLNKVCYKKDNTVLCRGRNLNNTISDSNNDIVENFVEIKNFNQENFLNIDNIILGNSYSLISSENKFYSWGDNSEGQMFNSLSQSSIYPLEVDDSSNLINPNVLFSIGSNNWCYKSDLGINCIGFNNNTFFVNENVNSNSSSFINYENEGIYEISSKSYDHRCFSKNSTIFCAGENLFSELGDNSNTTSTEPVQVLFQNN